ncbi:PIN domain-containing protein [Chlorogloeopsis sp. ULAP02]|uniref:type II toxin-antitoxin system VapC family toxin n=1 Tax=Chlorogloeopsis sp. ULAP02 TaxID=3107926 RepID=UPI0031358EFD
MRVLLDTNVILDYVLERQPFFINSEEVLSLVEVGQIEGYISASTLSDLYYIIRKEKGRDLALEFLREINTFCRVATITLIT